MSALADFIPLVAFFIAYKTAGMAVAVPTLMVFSVLLLAGYKAANKKISKPLMMSTLAVVLFGGLTIAVDDPLFIMIKPTVVFALMAVAIAVALKLGKNPIAAIGARSMPQVPDKAWRGAAWQWVVFFLLLAAANLIVFKMASEQAWVNFKVFGVTALMILFTSLQFMVLYRQHCTDDGKKDEREAPARPAG